MTLSCMVGLIYCAVKAFTKAVDKDKEGEENDPNAAAKKRKQVIDEIRSEHDPEKIMSGLFKK